MERIVSVFGGHGDLVAVIAAGAGLITLAAIVVIVVRAVRPAVRGPVRTPHRPPPGLAEQIADGLRAERIRRLERRLALLDGVAGWQTATPGRGRHDAGADGRDAA
ncbi:hypothetical protein AS850_09835 [Frondihabitans sp. 762G35]|uniref:hypothetical protein n=1 Tax=Frondihabitans sp. 762G35 TaxID=1446794 RepID=UPI000D22BAC4|nr:hypothetical protein [Frondihabitans sp. 762G35]ARC57375.1 hypothetical protein AS850_09835 [Frondihabitans sp. 762G35]